MNELLAHLFGDYVFQNHWMANRKTSSSFAATIHVAFYTSPFVILTQHWLAIVMIAGSHFVIDRYRLARYWVNFWGVGNTGWVGRKFGLDVQAAPDWLAIWLLIIVDNTFHLTINHVSIMYL